MMTTAMRSNCPSNHFYCNYDCPYKQETLDVLYHCLFSTPAIVFVTERYVSRLNVTRFTDEGTYRLYHIGQPTKGSVVHRSLLMSDVLMLMPSACKTFNDNTLHFCSMSDKKYILCCCVTCLK